jgi:hypothetical protein
MLSEQAYCMSGGQSDMSPIPVVIWVKVPEGAVASMAPQQATLPLTSKPQPNCSKGPMSLVSPPTLTWVNCPCAGWVKARAVKVGMAPTEILSTTKEANIFMTLSSMGCFDRPVKLRYRSCLRTFMSASTSERGMRHPRHAGDLAAAGNTWPRVASWSHRRTVPACTFMSVAVSSTVSISSSPITQLYTVQAMITRNNATILL